MMTFNLNLKWDAASESCLAHHSSILTGGAASLSFIGRRGRTPRRHVATPPACRQPAPAARPPKENRQ